eukprot:8315224-Ditylum_brightwellii.AAC.1
MAALSNPDGKDAKQALNKVLPLLKLGGKATRLCLLTIAPDDVNNPISLQLSRHSFNNSSFPAVISQELFLEQLINGSFIVGEGDINIPLGYNARAEAAANNPVATSLEYISLLN